MKIILNRFAHEPKQTRGRFTATGNGQTITGVTMELPWKDNARKVSCIPPGTYEFEPYNSVKFGRCFILKDVPGRDAILIHRGNFNRDTLGCILPGAGFADLDNDGLMDVISSGAKVNQLLELWDGAGIIEIT